MKMRKNTCPGDTAIVNVRVQIQDGTLSAAPRCFFVGEGTVKRLSYISPRQMGEEEEGDGTGPELSLRSSVAPADFLFFAKGYAWVPVHKVDRALGKSPGSSSPPDGPSSIWTASLSQRGSPRGHTSHGLLTRTTLRTENLSNWCPQVAQRATVGICAPNTSYSLLSPSSHLSSFSFSFFPWESAHEQRLTRQSSLKIWKDCDEKTGLWDHIGLDSIVPPSVKSGQWAYLCQINEPGWRLSGCKTIYLRPPSWHAADCRLSSGRVWVSGLALSEHALDCCPGKSFLRETESSTCKGRQASWGSGGEHRGFQLQIATHGVSGTSLETDIPLSLKNHHCEPQTWQNLAALNSDHPFPKPGIQKDGPPVSFPAIL